MSNAHTQGSWEVGYGSGLYGPRVSPTVYMHGNGFLEIPIRVGSQGVAWILSSSPDGKEDADARLISAAPELLEALQWMVQRADEGGYPDGRCLMSARAAVAKATGERA